MVTVTVTAVPGAALACLGGEVSLKDAVKERSSWAAASSLARLAAIVSQQGAAPGDVVSSVVQKAQ